MQKIADTFFEGSPIFGELDKISNYQYAIAYTKVPLLNDISVLNTIAGTLVASITDRLDEEKIFAADQLSVNIDEAQGIFITFSDDVYHFSIKMDSHSFIFARKGGLCRNL